MVRDVKVDQIKVASQEIRWKSMATSEVELDGITWDKIKGNSELMHEVALHEIKWKVELR